MQQIADWLEKLGMSEYSERFAENRIDFSVLPDLTDQNLKDLGIALGDRLKMLRAIRELASAVPASPQAALTEPKSRDSAERAQPMPMPAAVTPPISAAVEPAGERRYLTVMFAISSVLPALRRGSTPRSGATLSAPISMQPRSQ
jgi:SAM domain (Sterile alpha motif)